MRDKLLLGAFLLCLTLPLQAGDEFHKIRYDLQTAATLSSGKHAPFWLVSNRQGETSLTHNQAYLSAGLYRDFDKTQKFTWAYGIELIGAWHHTSPYYVQQLYADLKYHCWELSIGSKERWSEGKHRTLSGGGLTFSPNTRPIPQVRFGINEYTTAPWLFNEWVQVKGHFSYGRYTDAQFQRSHIANAPANSWYTTDILFHEKTAFFKIGNETRSPLSVEIGLEMYTQFGGKFYIKRNGMPDSLRYDIPHTYKEYLKAIYPMGGGSDAPASDQQNINGNVLGSWHLAANYQFSDWHLRAYYEHFYEDHSGLLGYHRIRKGEVVAYFPWYDGLYGLQMDFPSNRIIHTLVYEFITSRMQSGPIVNYWKDPLVGKDSYYNNSIYQSWQHWGMTLGNPYHLSPIYVEPATLKMPYTRLRSHHIGIEGSPTEQLSYRLMGAWTKHWGTHNDPLPHPQGVLNLMASLTYTPTQWKGWLFIGAFALDRSQLIGNNTGGMLTIRKQGFIKER